MSEPRFSVGDPVIPRRGLPREETTITKVRTAVWRGASDGSIYDLENGNSLYAHELEPAIHLATPDPVNHPAHYTQFPVEVIDITEHLSFNLGNVVKYACRAGRKDGADPIEDLRKAEFYLKREIGRLSSE